MSDTDMNPQGGDPLETRTLVLFDLAQSPFLE